MPTKPTAPGGIGSRIKRDDDGREQPEVIPGVRRKARRMREQGDRRPDDKRGCELPDGFGRAVEHRGKSLRAKCRASLVVALAAGFFREVISALKPLGQAGHFALCGGVVVNVAVTLAVARGLSRAR